MKLVGKAILVLITVAMAITMSFLVVIPNGTVKAQDSTFTVNSTGDAIDQSHPAQIAYSGDDIVVTMSLTSVSDQLTFNQSHVEDNGLEYSWGVRIDTDGNVSTGDGSGYDVEISLIHFKPPGNSPFTGTILDGTQKNTWVLSSSGAMSAHNIEAAIDHDTKSIIMIAKQSWEEFADFDINDRFCCKTYYYSPSGSVQDITSDNLPGSNIVSDPEGDVSYSFVDITGGKVQLPDTIPPDVSIPTGQNIISQADADYTISIGLGKELGVGDTITVTFPSDTVVSAPTANITASIGWIGGIYKDATLNAVTWTADSATQTVTATLGTGDEVGELAWVRIEITAGITNPSVPGDYTLTVHTSQETTPVESNAYTITPPTIPPVPGIVQLYNPADILMAQYTGDDAIQSAIDDAMVGYTVKVGLGTYKDNIELKDGVQVLGAGADITTIDGGGAGSVVTADSVGSETVLDGFTITGGSSDYGGGMYTGNSSLTVTNCTFTDNSARWNGGGMQNTISSPTVTNCTFSNNSAHYGGGMRDYSNSSPTVTNCAFSNNLAEFGGGIYHDASSLTVTSCTFTNNSATLDGGGICNIDGSPIVTNCTFSSNSANNHGGGIYSFRSSATLTNCTFANNSAPEGDGVYNVYHTSLTVTNCIFWDNGEEIGNYLTSTALVAYCDIQGGYPGDHNISEDPMFVDPTGNDYHLKISSPCIDKGTDVGAPTEDIEGNPRPIDGDGDGEVITDMGAFEYVPPVEPAIEATVDFDPDTLNLKSKGKVVTVYIALPEGYDVEETDISTVMLNGIVPALAYPTDVGDYDSDGVSDLMVKFDRPDVQDVLEPGNEVEVTVSGQLTDGTTFEGTDTIRVIEKEKK